VKKTDKLFLAEYKRKTILEAIVKNDLSTFGNFTVWRSKKHRIHPEYMVASPVRIKVD
jgi:hypothetical protein